LELNKSEIRIQDLSLRNFETEELITDEVIYDYMEKFFLF